MFTEVHPPFFHSNLFLLGFGQRMVRRHGAVEDEVHPAAAGASGTRAVAAVLAGRHVWDLRLLSGSLPQDRVAP